MNRFTLADAEGPQARSPSEHEPLLREVARQAPTIDPERSDVAEPLVALHRRRWWRRLWHPFALVVILPALLVTAFEYLVASDLFESEAHFIVRGAESGPSASGLGQLLGLSGGQVPADAHSVSDYLVSHDAVTALGKKLDLPSIFRRPAADIVTRLWEPAPAPETLLRYYRGKVDVDFDNETGITTMRVRAFQPDDAKRLADNLLLLGEARVNGLNARMLADGLAAATRQVREAEDQVAQAQAAITAFRQSKRDIDPERTSSAQISLASQLEVQAAQARAQLGAMAGAISPSAPQYVAMARQVHALEAQAGAARAQIAGSRGSMASGLGVYEELRLRQEFAAKRYDAAATALQTARQQLNRQQLFIVRVVEPNLPEKALYPKRLKIVATVLLGLMLAYAIGWLILAGVREHAS